MSENLKEDPSKTEETGWESVEITDGDTIRGDEAFAKMQATQSDEYNAGMAEDSEIAEATDRSVFAEIRAYDEKINGVDAEIAEVDARIYELSEKRQNLIKIRRELKQNRPIVKTAAELRAERRKRAPKIIAALLALGIATAGAATDKADDNVINGSPIREFAAVAQIEKDPYNIDSGNDTIAENNDGDISAIPIPIPQNSTDLDSNEPR